MKFITQRENLLRPLQLITSVIERRQTMPVLSNVLLVAADNNKLVMTCTDLEIELISNVELEGSITENSAITVPGKQLLDICRVLPEGAMIDFFYDNGRVILRSEQSRYVLNTMEATEFPNIDWSNEKEQGSFTITQKELRQLLASTKFAMAQQDVRYYLNGLLLEIKDGMLWAVATDGHRMALNGMESPVVNNKLLRIIVPYKGVAELMKLLKDGAEEVAVTIGSNHLRAITPDVVYTSKLVDAEYPDYSKAIPIACDKKIILDREALKTALSHLVILSDGMFCGVELQIAPGIMNLHVMNQTQERADEKIAIEYEGEEFTVGYNIHYLIDVLENSKAAKLLMSCKNGISSTTIEESDDSSHSLYVIMPLRK